MALPPAGRERTGAPNRCVGHRCTYRLRGPRSTVPAAAGRLPLYRLRECLERHLAGYRGPQVIQSAEREGEALFALACDQDRGNRRQAAGQPVPISAFDFATTEALSA